MRVQQNQPIGVCVGLPTKRETDLLSLSFLSSVSLWNIYAYQKRKNGLIFTFFKCKFTIFSMSALYIVNLKGKNNEIYAKNVRN